MPAAKAMRADARRNRAAIVAAARVAFGRNDQLRFDDFAELAGVGVGTLYRHFPTREALAAAVYQGEVTALFELAPARPHDLPGVLEELLRGFADYVIAHSTLARTLAVLVAPTIQKGAAASWSARWLNCDPGGRRRSHPTRFPAWRGDGHPSRDRFHGRSRELAGRGAGVRRTADRWTQTR